MIKINISNSMKKKHAQYILNSDIKDKFIKLKRNSTNFFDKEHNRFCDFMINQVQSLNDYINNKCENNIFIDGVYELDKRIKEVNLNYPNVSKKISEDEKYKDKILEAVSYEEFSAKKITSYFDIEEDFIRKYNKTNIKTRLREIKSYSADSHYNDNHFKTLLDEIIIDLNKLIFINNKINEVLKVLKEIKSNLAILKKLDSIDKNRMIEKIVNEIIKIESINLKNKNINIMNYKQYCEKFDEDFYEWSAYNFVLELGLKVCPYCNRQYITPLYSLNNKVRGDLDHFYPKSKYPYLAMSIYNLVPCCKFCNSSLKGSREFSYEEYISPYDVDMDEYIKFNYYPTSYKSFYNSEDLIIKIEPKENVDRSILNKCINNLKVFQVEELYQYHSDIVSSLLKKRIVYDDIYIDNLVKRYNKLFKSKEEAMQILFKNSTDKKENLPLSKLIDDILEELKM